MKILRSVALVLTFLPASSLAAQNPFAEYSGGLAVIGTNENVNCHDCTSCLSCKGAEEDPNDPNYLIVHVDGQACKNENLSWLCCAGAAHPDYTDHEYLVRTPDNVEFTSNEDWELCEMHSCPSTIDDNKCPSTTQFDVRVPKGTTTIVVAGHDGLMSNNIVDNTGYEWCGPVNGGSCTTGGNGYCVTSIDIRSCGCDGCTVGDPHFKTWAGDWYDYHGVCDLVFLTEPTFAKGLGLDIHIRTTGRDDFSYIESAAVRIGTDVFEVGGWGEHLLNGVDGADFPAKLGPFPIHYKMENKKKHHFEIPYSEGKSIQIHTVKDLVTVQMHNASIFEFKNSGGMMGEFRTGKFMGRDGKTDFGAMGRTSHDDFGQEWQVRDTDPKLFDSVRAPQYPEKCIIPHRATTATHRRLGEGIARDAATEACAHWPEDARNLCIADVMAMGDVEVAQVGGMF